MGLFTHRMANYFCHVCEYVRPSDLVQPLFSLNLLLCAGAPQVVLNGRTAAVGRRTGSCRANGMRQKDSRCNCLVDCFSIQ